MVKVHLDKIVNPEPNCLESNDDFNDGYWFEARDRLATINVMIHELLDNHPAILRTPGGQEAITKSIQDIEALYHMVYDAEENLDKHVTKE